MHTLFLSCERSSFLFSSPHKPTQSFATISEQLVMATACDRDTMSVVVLILKLELTLQCSKETIRTQSPYCVSRLSFATESTTLSLISCISLKTAQPKKL